MASSLTSSDPTAYTSVNVANFVSSALCSHDINNSSNYWLWRLQMLCLIESQGLLAFIDGSPPPTTKNNDRDYDAWKRTDRLIMGWIFGALSDAVAGTVINFSCARDVWLQLEKNFTTSGPAAPLPNMAVGLVDKYPQLARMRPRPSISALMQITARAKAFSIEAQLNLFQRIIYNCIQLGSPLVQPTDVENQTCCGQLLEEVPRWWRGVVATLKSTISKVIKLLTILPHVKRIYEKKVMHRDALRLVKCLCKHMESMTYNEATEIFREVMISAATLGIAEVIEAVVDTFPRAIYFADASNQNFLHIAVKNRCLTVFNLMYRTTNHRYQYSNEVDTSGNNIHHLAATLAPPHKLNLVSGAALQMQREIQWFQEADKFISPYNRGAFNKDGKTPEMVFTEEHREIKVEGEKWMKDTANSCTIAAALIVTVVFAAAITVPGGNDQSSGYPVFLGAHPAFAVFAVSDAISLFTSTTSLLMFLSILTSRYVEQDFLYALPMRLSIGLVSLFISILFMMTAFCSTLYLVFGKNIKGWILIPVTAFA